MPFSRRLEILLWLPVVSALVLSTPQDLRTLTINSSLTAVLSGSGVDAATFTNQSDQNDVSIRCETGAGRQYGSPKFISCVDALEEIPRTTDLLFFGKRGTAVQGVIGLPARYISSDGDCIIDVEYAGRVGDTDLETYKDMWTSAETLAYECVFAPKGISHGGIAAELGAIGEISITMQQYFPKVSCWPSSRPGRGLNVKACQVLLDGMLTTSSSQIFGQRGTPGVEVPLPQRFSSENGDCSIALLVDGPPLLTTWHEIWGAAVAVAGMCVRSSKTGIAVIQSGDSKISVAFRRAFV